MGLIFFFFHKDEPVLHIAVRKSHKQCINVLISNGADINLKNSLNKTIFEIVENEEILNFILKFKN